MGVTSWPNNHLLLGLSIAGGILGAIAGWVTIRCYYQKQFPDKD